MTLAFFLWLIAAPIEQLYEARYACVAKQVVCTGEQIWAVQTKIREHENGHD